MKQTYFFLTILMLFISGVIFSQQKRLDSLIKTTTSIADSSNINLASDLIYQLSIDEKYDEGLTFCDTFIRISKFIKHPKGTGRIYIEKANIYNITDKSFKAMQSYDQAENYFQIAKYDRGIAVTNNNKSIIEHRLGNLEKSINLLLKANVYYKKLNDSISLADTFNNIGNVYHTLKQTASAKEYYKKSIAIKRKNELKTLGSTLNNLALIYIDTKEIDTAIVILNEALEENKKQNDSRSMSGTYSALGRIHLDQKNYNKAKEYFEASMFVGGKIEYKRRLVITKHALAAIAIKTGNLNEAERHLNDARIKSGELNSISQLLVNYKYTAQLDSAKGNFASAYEWQKKHQNLLNEETKIEKRKNVSITQQKLENEQEQQKTIEKQRLNELKANENLLLQKIYTYIVIVALIVAMTFIVFIVKSRLERAKYINQLNETNQVKNKLFSIVSHDLKNEIHGLNNTLNLLKNDIISEKEFKAIIPMLSDSTHQTTILLTNLLNWSRSQMNKLQANPTMLDFTEIIKDKFRFFESRASQKGIKLVNKLTDATLVYADKDMSTIVTQNLIANAIKFCNSGDTITIFKKEEENLIQICFFDTGIGISEENVIKLFSEETISTKGTDNETGTGLGLKICKELITLNRGTLDVESTLGEGSTFCITLPKTSDV
ncbi:tetratricopeptide repeat-containing sensor histidine kinase [uncultured Aquimarina sp.]|uniref:tetratricopeptide repeat-containing sensor histidine kinase n=1 Tax=uncultured Aquimarina sp. TaxID=575652 RepID=UPI0026047B50|nr:tetratricopeptide repeat-containing sensor histidine kinase [uncultured Aquimarina sp.]